MVIVPFNRSATLPNFKPAQTGKLVEPSPGQNHALAFTFDDGVEVGDNRFQLAGLEVLLHGLCEGKRQ
jgi:hypothetical protein